MSSEADEGAAEEEGAGQPATSRPGPGDGRRGDSTRQQVVEAFRAELDDAVVASEVSGDDVWVRVDRTAWRQAAEACRRRLDMDYFCFLSGIDWLVNPELSGEKLWDPPGETPGETPGAETGAEDGVYQTGVAGGETRFQLLARLYSTTRKVGVTLKADLDEEDPRVASLVGVYRGADWHEREAWEMYGFTFEGHPGLRHLYLPGEFEGHPLRKDFPLLAREVKPWPGLVDVEPIPGEEAPEEGAAEDEGAGAETASATGEGG
ncbi:MAG: NADH-quinone oxidoreductase subunit C [Actinomycetota bacterium]|nr:NADH-quinone oxidoreductase subunit C [Actinomycetota bacterium]